MIDFAQM